MPSPSISSAMEDYLKAIYELGSDDIGTQAIATRLGVSAASVTGMLKKLANLKLVAYRRYHGASLTDAGRKVALETIRHHRLIETFLLEALGYDWHEVHDEADKLEHHISEDFERRIASVLGNPTHDPHGDPIPRRDGSVPESDGAPLPSFATGAALRITRILRQEPALLAYLAEQGLRPGARVRLLTVEPVAGRVVLEHEGASLPLGFEVAKAIQAVEIAAGGTGPTAE